MKSLALKTMLNPNKGKGVMMLKIHNLLSTSALSAVALVMGSLTVPASADTSSPYYTPDTGHQVILLSTSPMASNAAVVPATTIPAVAAPDSLSTTPAPTIISTSTLSPSQATAPVTPQANALNNAPLNTVTMNNFQDTQRLNPFHFGVETRSGFDVGVQVSDYHYREPDLDVSLNGFKGGIIADATGKISSYFVTGSVRYVAGSSDYSSWATASSPTSSGTQSNLYEGLWDVRALLGHDFIVSNYDISPYVGLAYRNLYSDDRGTTSLGFGGYRRNNDLFYMPFGATQRIMLSKTDRLSVTLEYDQLLLGIQKSYLSDVGNGSPDITNLQHSGRGIRGEIMWEQPTWSVGPFMNYWNIDSSTIKSACGPGLCLTGEEPHNHTLEFGLQAKYHFFGF